MFIELENRCDIAATITVVWGTPNRHDRLIKHHLVPLHRQLVGSGDEVDGIIMSERFGDIGSEKEASSTRRKTPARNIIRIGPEQVAHGSVMRNLLLSIYSPNLIDSLQHRTQAAVDAKDAAVDDGAQGEIIKDFATPAPYVAAAVLALTLVVKPVHLCDLPRLVVSTDERDAIWIAHFERQEKEEGFDAVETSIHEVSNEDVIRFWAGAANLEQLHQIKELSMDVATNGYWGVDDLDIALLDKDFSCLDAQSLNLFL